jgi:Uma2 family endonuclease
MAGQLSDTIVNPTVIVEVLSDSTEAYDRGKKFEHYRQIAALKEYILISQKEPRIERFSRGPADSWLLTEAAGVDKKLEIGALGIEIDLGEIFAEVDFPPRSIR